MAMIIEDDGRNLNRLHGPSVVKVAPIPTKEALVALMGLPGELMDDKNFAVSCAATETFADGFATAYVGYHYTNPDWSLRTIGISPTLTRKITWIKP